MTFSQTTVSAGNQGKSQLFIKPWKRIEKDTKLKTIRAEDGRCLMMIGDTSTSTRSGMFHHKQQDNKTTKNPTNMLETQHIPSCCSEWRPFGIILNEITTYWPVIYQTTTECCHLSWKTRRRQAERDNLNKNVLKEILTLGVLKDSLHSNTWKKWKAYRRPGAQWTKGKTEKENTGKAPLCFFCYFSWLKNSSFDF